jgi:hypothetical protein
MKKRFIVLVAIIAISLIVSVSALLIVKNASNSPPQKNQISCNVLQENSGGINLVFFATEEQARRYVDYFLSVEPYASNKNKFSFYYVTPEQYKPDCSIYQGIAVLCQSSDLTKTASTCPNDYTIVLDGKQPASIRSSYFKGVLSLNLNHPSSVFIHEIGHGLANLAEEYDNPGSLPKGQKNCKQSCEDFNEFPGEFGCFKGCTNNNYCRECEDCVMRTLSSEEYGKYNSLLVQDEINSQFRGSNTITGNVISSIDCSEQSFYLVQIDNQGDIQKELVQGCAPGRNRFGSSYYQVTDSSSNIISEGNLDSEMLYTTDLTETGEITAIPEIPKDIPEIITVPTTGNENEIKVFDENKNMLFQTTLTGVGTSPCKI